MKYKGLKEVYPVKMCVFCSNKTDKCERDYILKGKNVISIKCRNYKRETRKWVSLFLFD